MLLFACYCTQSVFEFELLSTFDFYVWPFPKECCKFKILLILTLTNYYTEIIFQIWNVLLNCNTKQEISQCYWKCLLPRILLFMTRRIVVRMSMTHSFQLQHSFKYHFQKGKEKLFIYWKRVKYEHLVFLNLSSSSSLKWLIFPSFEKKSLFAHICNMLDLYLLHNFF